jgi:hypothetical protein
LEIHPTYTLNVRVSPDLQHGWMLCRLEFETLSIDLLGRQEAEPPVGAGATGPRTSAAQP